jgi:hypothetical protein
MSSRRTLSPAFTAFTRAEGSPAALPPRCSTSAPSFLCATAANLAVFLHRRVRCTPTVSGPSCPVLPWAWAPLHPPAFAVGQRSQYVKDGSCEPAFRLRPFGFRRCRRPYKQAACQLFTTKQRRFFRGRWEMQIPSKVHRFADYRSINLKAHLFAGTTIPTTRYTDSTSGKADSALNKET